MIQDLSHAGEIPDRHYDVCIVGAGAAGIALAVELVAAGKQVLLLEAGGDMPDEDDHRLYEAEIVGLPYAGVLEGRFRALGGTTTRWGGQILELDEIDFRLRSWVPGSGWPIEKADLRRGYDRALQIEGVDGAIREDGDVLKSLGLAAPVLGQDIEYAYSRWCPERNFASIHRRTLRNAPNLTVYTHANLCEIRVADDGRTSVAARCRTPTGREALFRASKFALCLGGIETSRFLLQPQPNGIALSAPRNPWIGRHYQDHISAAVGTLRDFNLRPALKYVDYVALAGRKYHPKFKLAAAAQARLGILNVCGTVAFLDPQSETLSIAGHALRHLRAGNVQEVRGASLRGLIAGAPALLRRSIHSLMNAGVAYRSPASEMRFTVHCEQAPLSESSVSLSEDVDSLGLRKARVDWRTSEAEQATIRAFLRLVEVEFRDHGIGRLEIDAGVDRDDEVLVSKFVDCNHHMGGARMAHSADDGVVDTNLRLFGSENVFICSSAVFPTSGFSNPTHTIVALAVRLAAHLTGSPPAASLA